MLQGLQVQVPAAGGGERGDERVGFWDCSILASKCGHHSDFISWTSFIAYFKV